MNREIKFRAWHVLNKEMVYENKGQNFGYGNYTRSDILKDFEDENIMQYTGLKDKNGKEIYEGDIVKSKPYLFTGQYIIGQVKFDERRAMWIVEEIDEKWKETEYLFEALKEPHETEIIGNIYENPELLNS